LKIHDILKTIKTILRFVRAMFITEISSKLFDE